MEEKSELEEVGLRFIRAGLSLEFVPEDFLTAGVALEAVKKNPKDLEFLPSRLKTKDFYTKAMQYNPVLLEFLPGDVKTKDMCFEAVKQDARLLQFVPAEFKKYCIDQISVAKLLTDNYSVHQYFPAEYQEQVQHCLANIEHVVVVFTEQELADQEIKDSYQVYANKTSISHPEKTRVGKTLLVYEKDLPELLNKLQSNKSIHLTLLDHSAPVPISAGMDVEAIKNTLKAHSNINKVTLLSCESARASALSAEEKAIAKFKREEGAFFSASYGLAYMTHEPSQKNTEQLLKKQEGCYVLIEQNNKKICMLLQQNSPPKTMELSEEQFEAMKKHFLGNKDFKIPKQASYQQIKGIENQLTVSDKLFLLTTLELISFKRGHPKYKETKSKFPHLQSVVIESSDETEMNKLGPSLLTYLMEAIKNCTEIKQEVVLQAFRNIVQVDLEEGRFLNTTAPIFKSGYPKKIFDKEEGNIDRPEQEKQTAKTVEGMQEGPEEIAQSLKIHHKP